MDVNGDGQKEILIIVDDRIEARNTMDGSLIKTFLITPDSQIVSQGVSIM
jgi:hypothetical protein